MIALYEFMGPKIESSPYFKAKIKNAFPRAPKNPPINAQRIVSGEMPA